MFTGSMVAIVTPMNQSGEVDFSTFERLLEMHIAAGTDAIVVTGTTGEAGTLTTSEKKKVISHAVNTLKGKCPIIAGTAAISTQETIENTRSAMEAGVDACLITTPVYIKPTQEGLYLHYSAIAEAVAVPQILYNVPSRTACDILPETVRRLSKIANIVGIKEATADMARAQQILAECGEHLSVYSGDDASCLALLLLGGHGVISVTANVAPKAMRDMVACALNNDIDGAVALNNRLSSLHRRLFAESNPIPTKWCLAELGLIENVLRLPLTPLANCYHEALRDALENVSG